MGMSKKKLRKQARRLHEAEVVAMILLKDMCESAIVNSELSAAQKGLARYWLQYLERRQENLTVEETNPAEEIAQA